MRGLLDRLGRPSAGNRDEVASIAAHLKVMLNARQGHSETSPTFGIVDFNSIVHTMPDGIGALQECIRDTISTHEPRLEHIRVTRVESDQVLSIRFEIRARMRRTRAIVRMHTRVMPGGLFEVS